MIQLKNASPLEFANFLKKEFNAPNAWYAWDLTTFENMPGDLKLFIIDAAEFFFSRPYQNGEIEKKLSYNFFGCPLLTLNPFIKNQIVGWTREFYRLYSLEYGLITIDIKSFLMQFLDKSIPFKRKLNNAGLLFDEELI